MNFDDWLKKMIQITSADYNMSVKEAEGLWKKIIKVLNRNLKRK